MLKAVFSPARFTGWHMMGVLGLFFGTIIAVNATLAVFASGTWTGLVVKNSYVASQEFNEKLAEAEAQADLGWSGTLAYEEGALTFRLVDADGQAVRADAVTVALGRPAYEGKDHHLALIARGDGRYVGEESLEPGPWRARVEATLPGGERWVMNHRFLVSE